MIAIFVLFACAAAASAANQSISVKLYYEAMCPDSIQFFNKQLVPVYRELKNDVNFNLHLVPFGKSKIINTNPDEPIALECRHGPQECYGHKIQACAISQYSHNQDMLVNFVDCLMMKSTDKTRPYPYKECGSFGINMNQLENCANSTTVNNLVQQNKKETEQLNPPLKSVPRIIVNDKSSESDTMTAEKNFKGIVCKYLDSPKPKACDKVSGSPFLLANGATILAVLVASVLM